MRNLTTGIARDRAGRRRRFVEVIDRRAASVQAGGVTRVWGLPGEPVLRALQAVRNVWVSGAELGSRTSDERSLRAADRSRLPGTYLANPLIPSYGCLTTHPQRALRHSRWCLRASLTSCSTGSLGVSMIDRDRTFH